MLDQFYLSVLNTLKKSAGKNAFTLALVYISLIEISILVMLGNFFTAFASQLHLTLMSRTKALVLFVLLSFFIIVKNWLRYNGKRRNVLNARSKKTYAMWLLLLVPVFCMILAYIFYQSI